MTSLWLIAMIMMADRPMPRLSHSAPSWCFVAEEVRVDVSESAFTVRGVYRFRMAPDAGALVFRYPFPADTTLGVPELIEASITGGPVPKALRVVEDRDCWRWVAEPDGADSCAIRIVYVQRMSQGRARYVLASTQEWGRPIGRARIEVCVPASGSYHIEPTLRLEASGPTQRTYRGDFTAFFPSEDLLIEVERVDENARRGGD